MVAARLNPTLPCTTDESLATQGATALIGKLASRRMRARLGFPVTATMRRDAQLARASAPMVARSPRTHHRQEGPVEAGRQP